MRPSWPIQAAQADASQAHPSHGGRGYDTWFPREQLAKAAAGEDVDVSMSTIRQWGERLELEPYRATGNKAREKIVGVDLINLVTFLRAWPESQLEEMAEFGVSRAVEQQPTFSVIFGTTFARR